jgi:L-aspartate oxidase
VLSHATAIDACLAEDACRGVRFLDARGEVHIAQARAVLLATGGAGQLYQFTTNPAVATGDGLALAFRAGAALADLEFVQLHPTALDVAGEVPFLLSEALRGEGARLVNEQGEAFMSRYEPAGELAPRDRVARAIAQESARTGGRVFLSTRHLPAPWVHQRFPSISDACRGAGLDLARDLIPVRPAAHYLMGGVVTDLDGRTTVPGLFAAGEVACTGVHGANRLASNSLLEGLVFGARAALAMRHYMQTPGAWPFTADAEAVAPLEGAGGLTPAEIRRVMWDHVGLRRTREGLTEALRVLGRPSGSGGPGQGDLRATMEAENLRLDGWLMARAALRREESRGAHFRDDFPIRDDARWARHVRDRRA